MDDKGRDKDPMEFSQGRDLLFVIDIEADADPVRALKLSDGVLAVWRIAFQNEFKAFDACACMSAPDAVRLLERAGISAPHGTRRVVAMEQIRSRSAGRYLPTGRVLVFDGDDADPLRSQISAANAARLGSAGYGASCNGSYPKITIVPSAFDVEDLLGTPRGAGVASSLWRAVPEQDGERMRGIVRIGGATANGWIKSWIGGEAVSPPFTYSGAVPASLAGRSYDEVLAVASICRTLCLCTEDNSGSELRRDLGTDIMRCISGGEWKHDASAFPLAWVHMDMPNPDGGLAMLWHQMRETAGFPNHAFIIGNVKWNPEYMQRLMSVALDTAGKIDLSLGEGTTDEIVAAYLEHGVPAEDIVLSFAR
jgi:hypothetical protein